MATPVNPKYPGIPTPTDDPAQHTKSLLILKESVEIGQRLRGDPLDSFVRLRELRDLGLARTGSGGPVTPSTSDSTKFWRGDETWSDTLTGAFTALGLITGGSLAIGAGATVGGATQLNSTLGVTGVGTFNAGGGALSLKPGANDHVYMQWFADTAAPGTRSGWMGYGSAGTNTMTITNEMVGGEINLATQNVERMSISAAGTVRAHAQGRFAGWYETPESDANGLAVEAGVSAGQAYLLAYNRTVGAYGVLNLGGTAINFTQGLAHAQMNLLVSTTGNAAASRTVALKDSAQGLLGYGNYAGAWRTALQLQSNNNQHLLFMVPPDAGHLYSIVKSINGGFQFYVGGGDATLAPAGTLSIQIDDAGLVNVMKSGVAVATFGDRGVSGHIFTGTTHTTHFHYGAEESIYIRSGKITGSVYIGDTTNVSINIGAGSTSGVAIGSPTTISTGTVQPLKLSTSAPGPWALELNRSDLALSTRVFAHNYGGTIGWVFEHRPSVQGDDFVVESDVTETATGSKIVRRNSSGYVFANYFNQSSGNNENPTVSQFYVDNGSDGYLRKASVAHAVTTLVALRDVPRRTSGFARGECTAISAGITLNTSDMAEGRTFSVYNDSAAAITITQGSGVTLRLGGTATTGNRTLAQRGIATIWCNSGTEAVIGGVGVT